MYWIALKMLVGDRAKFLGIVLGLTFAAALITQQGSIFCGLMLRTCAQITDITGADLWVMDPASGSWTTSSRCSRATSSAFGASRE